MKKLLVSLLTTLAVTAGVVGLSVAPAQAATVYYYAGGGQQFTGATKPTQLLANVEVVTSSFDSTKEYHSVVELAYMNDAAAGGSGRQTIEVGYGISNLDNTTVPKLWVSHTINGTWQGYNSASFVQCNGCSGSPDNWDLGDTLTNGTTMRLGIILSGGDYWVQANISSNPTPEYLGYFPGSLWSSQGITFTTANKIYAYGEVATETSLGGLGCTDLDTGAFPSFVAPSTLNGTIIGSITASPVANSAIDIDATPFVTDATKYNYASSGTTNTRTIAIGGPGAC